MTALIHSYVTLRSTLGLKIESHNARKIWFILRYSKRYSFKKLHHFSIIIPSVFLGLTPVLLFCLKERPFCWVNLFFTTKGIFFFFITQAKHAKNIPSHSLMNRLNRYPTRRQNDVVWTLKRWKNVEKTFFWRRAMAQYFLRIGFMVSSIMIPLYFRLYKIFKLV